MSLRSVQLLSPDARFLPSAAPHYAHVSGEIVDVLADFSPDIEPQELWHSFPNSALATTAHGYQLPARYCLDLAGLPQAEAVPFMQEMGQRVRAETRFAPAIGLSADPFAAQVAAAVCRPERLLPVAADGAAEFLSSRSLDFLPLSKETSRRLHLMGIRTLGQFARLPAPAVREQFGREVEPLHRLAQGEGGQPLQPRPAERREEVQRRFDDPLTNSLILGDIVGQMAGELAQRLQAAGLEGCNLSFNLKTENGQNLRQNLTLRHPTADARRLVAALTELAATVEHSCGVVGVVVAVGNLTPAMAYQLGLFDRQLGDSSPFYRALHNLIAKYRSCGFYRPVLAEHPHPLPERRFQLEALTHDPAVV
jgi:nucleotidyltransferase/DNA polymerase involved in DNA repair